MNPLTTLRWVAPIEATTFLALLLASYIKHQGDGAAGVSILGPIHGILFLAFVGLALVLRREAPWSNKTTALVILGAIVPFGGYVVDRWLLRQPAAV